MTAWNDTVAEIVRTRQPHRPLAEDLANAMPDFAPVLVKIEDSYRRLLLSEQQREQREGGKRLSKQKARLRGWNAGVLEAPSKQDILWVAQSMAVACEEADAPNLGAWALLQWAQLNQKEFYCQMYTKVLPKEDEETASRMRDSGKRQVELAEGLLRSLRKDTVGA